MTHPGRRRFLAISAGAMTGLAAPTAADRLHQWRGIALGADASITLAHPDAADIVAAARAEIDRLEAVFSLYRPDSALSRLNAAGDLEAPPFDLLECLSLCGAVHDATGGLFDPTIQPLWRLYAEERGYPSAAALTNALERVGWAQVRISPTRISLGKPGMALTLNGVAQGYVADRVTTLLRRAGLHNVLVETGEFRALGGNPAGGGWPVMLGTESDAMAKPVMLRDRALASSAPRGTVFDRGANLGHILDPRSGQPSSAPWRLVSVTAPSAGLADALSTAFCLMDRPRIDSTLAAFAGARLERLV